MANRLNEVVWAYNITQKTTIGLIPYELVFGKKVMLPIEFEHKTLRMLSQLELDIRECKKDRLCQLNQLDELIQEALFHTKMV